MLNAKIAGNLFKILPKRHIITHPKYQLAAHIVKSLTSRHAELLENCSTHINVGGGVET